MEAELPTSPWMVLWTTVAIGASTWFAYTRSLQYRVECSLKRQGIPAQYGTSWPFLGHLGQFWDSDRLLLETMGKNAPPVMYLTTFGYPLLVISDAALSVELWNVSKAWPKPKFFYQSIDALFATTKRTLLTHYSDTSPEWQQKRSMVSHALHKKNLLVLARYIEEQVHSLCNDWIQRQTNIEVDPDLTNLTLRVIIFFIFGQRLQPTEVQPVVQALLTMVHFAWDMASNPLQGIKTVLPSSEPYKASRVFRSFVCRLIDQARRIEVPTTSTNEGFLIHSLLQQSDWSQEVLENEIMVLLFAGHDTTAHTTTIAIQECLDHGQVIDKIRQEYRSLLDSNDGETEMTSFYYKMKWPTAAFKEALRLNPAAPGGTVREAPCDTRLSIGNNNQITIPAGCAVLSPMWIFSRSVGNWGPEAKEFRPERFHATTPPIGADFPCSYIPFSLGKRNCVGMPLAYLEGSMLLGHVLTHLDITVRSPVKRVWTMTLRAENMLIDVKPRQW